MQRPGNQFLARAALALNQDGLVARPRTLDQPKHLLDGRRLADHLRPGFAAFEQRFELPVLLAQQPLLIGFLDLYFEFFERKRFGQIVERSKLHGLHGGFHGRAAGKQDDFAFDVPALEAFEQFHSGHSRHDHVEDRHVEIATSGQIERFLRIARFGNPIPVTAEVAGHYPAKLLIVIHQQ